MSRYIDADVLRESLKDWFEFFDWDDGEIEKHTIATVIRTIDSQPTADVVEVVRCKECEEWQTEWIPDNGKVGSHFCPAMEFCTKPDDYCSYGERKILPKD